VPETLISRYLAPREAVFTAAAELSLLVVGYLSFTLLLWQAVKYTGY